MARIVIDTRDEVGWAWRWRAMAVVRPITPAMIR